jgi:hypothetical protein
VKLDGPSLRINVEPLEARGIELPEAEPEPEAPREGREPAFGPEPQPAARS